jgi:all-trans-retinol dehydrogenase (NAD+)
VITGGSSGIGTSIVLQLISRNPRTKIINIDHSPLAFKQPRNSHIHFYQCDLSSSEAVKEVCARIRSEVGAPTALINNAGLTRGFTVMEGSYAGVDLTMRTNLVAPFLLLKEFLPEMVRENHGHIVNMSSMSALIPPAGLADYAASKAGLVALHEVRDRAEDEDEVEHMAINREFGRSPSSSKTDKKRLGCDCRS